MQVALRRRIRPENPQRHHEIARVEISRKFPAGWHHPENGKRPGSHLHNASDDLRIARKGALPQIVTNHHDIRRAGFRFLRRESAAKRWRDTNRFEEIAIDSDAVHFLRFTRVGQHGPGAAVGGDRAEAAALRAEIKHVGQRLGLARIRTARSRAPDIHELLWMRIGQRAQQHGIDDAENCAVRANAECKRRDRDNAEAGRLQQHAERVTKISHHIRCSVEVTQATRSGGLQTAESRRAVWKAPLLGSPTRAPEFYSYRSATIGSTFMARRAGM